jgi:hypothetical protein
LDAKIPEALSYAQANLLPHFAKHGEDILKLLTAYLYQASDSVPTPYQDVADPNIHAPLLVPLFTAEFCRLHGWAREEPLDVVVDLGGRGGALSMIEKGRRVMGDRLGDVREWKELPVCLVSGCQHSANMHVDGDTSAFGTALSLRVRLSCLQGSRNRFKPSTNARLRPCYCGRELQASAQGQVRIYAVSLDKVACG